MLVRVKSVTTWSGQRSRIGPVRDQGSGFQEVGAKRKIINCKGVNRAQREHKELFRELSNHVAISILISPPSQVTISN